MKQIFKLQTGILYYDNMLKNKNYYETKEGITYEIVYMTPDEYMRRSAEIQGTSLKEQYDMIDAENVDRLKKLVLNGTKLPLVVLDYHSRTQEGRHRVFLAKMLSIKKIPVMVVRKLNC